jgi:hypothetical protein
MDEVPLNSHEVKALISVCLEAGRVIFLPHARREMAKDNLTEAEIIAVARGGIVEPAEFENSAWRYRIRLVRAAGRALVTTYCVVEFEQRHEMWTLVVTAWKKTER